MVFTIILARRVVDLGTRRGVAGNHRRTCCSPGLSKPSDFARAREILEECLDAYPDFLIGHAAHKPFKEWNDKCARGRVTGIDKDHAGNTLWQIRYEADGKEEDYDKSDS